MPFGVHCRPATDADLFDGLRAARRALDTAVVGMDDAKRRVLMAAAERRIVASARQRATPLLLVGPPGVGKTTIASAGVAAALQTKCVHMSLGGLEDSTVLRGSSEVYLGATHGLIADALMRAECMDPVIVCDEVDKISAGQRGRDVASTFLHTMDPTQNANFEDTFFVGVSIDLSAVQWVLTANRLQDVPAALVDRCEVLHIAPPSAAERRSILEGMALPRALARFGLSPDAARLSPEATELLVGVGGAGGDTEGSSSRDSGMRGAIRALDGAVASLAVELRLGRDAMREIGLPVERGRGTASSRMIDADAVRRTMAAKGDSRISPHLEHIYT